MKDRSKITYHARENVNPTKLKKTNSFLNIADNKTKEIDRYDFDKHLGEGTYGYVRLFKHGDDQIAVKALKEDKKKKDLHHLTKEAADDWQNELETEFNLMREAYPDDRYYSIHHYRQREADKNGYIYDCRITMPFIKGCKLSTFAHDHIVETRDMALLMLRVTQELQRIHEEAGIIHGDAGARNIMVDEEDDDFTVHFLDFGMAYRIDGYAKVNYEKDRPSDATSGDMAPERIPNRRLKARPEQDVYSLAKTFNKLIKNRDEKWKKQFLSEFPLIAQFIRKGVLDWKERTDLTEFIHQLEANLDWEAHLDDSLNPLISLIVKNNFGRIKKLLNESSTEYNNDALAPLLNQLLLNRQYDHAQALMSIRKKIPIDQLFHGNHCLHIAVSDRDINFDVFNKLLNYLPKKQLADVINQPNQCGDTVMHIAAAAGRLEIVTELLTYHPDLSVKNSEGKTPTEIAHPDVAPVLQLIEYITQLEAARSSNDSRLFASKDMSRKLKALSAAHYLKELIIHGDDEDDIDQHIKAITSTPELNEIYKGLCERKILPSNDNGFLGLGLSKWF